MKFTKLQIAKIQLEQALKSYFEENYIVYITLGGAAEEILAFLLKNERNLDSSMDVAKKGTRMIYKKWMAQI